MYRSSIYLFRLLDFLAVDLDYFALCTPLTYMILQYYHFYQTLRGMFNLYLSTSSCAHSNCLHLRQVPMSMEAYLRIHYSFIYLLHTYFIDVLVMTFEHDIMSSCFHVHIGLTLYYRRWPLFVMSTMSTNSSLTFYFTCLELVS